MFGLKVITYAESREAFFLKKLKQAEKSLDNVVKYGTDPGACAEKGEIVAFYRDALAALREAAEREKGCDWCKEPNISMLVITNKKTKHGVWCENHTPIHCPMCGREMTQEATE